MIKYLNDSQMLIVGCRCFVEIGWEQRNSPLISIPSHIILGFENIQHSSFYHRMYSSGWAKQSSYLFTYNCSRTVVAEGKVLPQFLKPSPVVGNQCQSKIASSSLQHMAAKRIRISCKELHGVGQFHALKIKHSLNPKKLSFFMVWVWNAMKTISGESIFDPQQWHTICFRLFPFHVQHFWKLMDFMFTSLSEEFSASFINCSFLDHLINHAQT